MYGDRLGVWGSVGDQVGIRHGMSSRQMDETEYENAVHVHPNEKIRGRVSRVVLVKD